MWYRLLLTSFYIVALLSRFKCFFRKTLHDKVLDSIVFQAFSYYSNKWFGFFTQIFANKVKLSQTWCFAMLEKSCLTYWKNRVWLMVGWKPYLRKLPVTDVWLDLGLTQTGQGYKKKNAFQRNQFTDYMT